MPRRIPSFPVSFEISRPTRFSKAQSKMYFANEWEEYQKSLHHDDVASTSAPADAPQPIATPNDTHATVSPVAENTGAIAAPASSPASVSPPPGTVHSQLLGSGRRPLLPPDFSRHARRCCICSHPDRDAIEGDFIRWHSVELIAREYKIATRKSIYRHAHCTGLFAWRARPRSRRHSRKRGTRSPRLLRRHRSRRPHLRAPRRKRKLVRASAHQFHFHCTRLVPLSPGKQFVSELGARQAPSRKAAQNSHKF